MSVESCELDCSTYNKVGVKYKDYKDLPRRSIIKTVQRDGDLYRKIHTFGVLAKINGTNKWLLVRTRHTAAISYLLHGAYQPVHFSSLLKSITLRELKLLRSIETFEDFRAVYRKIFECECRSNYGYIRLLDLKEELYFDDVTDNQPDDTLFSIPKGRRILDENSKLTALREFYEETGFTTGDGVLSEKSIIFETTGLADRRYSIEIWGLTLKEDADLSKVPYPDKREIVERKFIEIDPDKYPKATVGQHLKSDSGELLDRETIMLIKKVVKAGLVQCIES